MRRVVFDLSFAGFIGQFEEDANVDWLHTQDFSVPFGYWKALLDERRDVFLGYCGTSASTADAVKRYLTSLGARVLDWRTDFIPGRTIIDQIERAASICSAGIFLFTRDDDLGAPGEPGSVAAAPRDNVVFEAGYFSGLKGKQKVLVIRETGSKMPADLGGDIYASLHDRTDISPVEGAIRSFIAAV